MLDQAKVERSVLNLKSWQIKAFVKRGHLLQKNCTNPEKTRFERPVEADKNSNFQVPIILQHTSNKMHDLQQVLLMTNTKFSKL